MLCGVRNAVEITLTHFFPLTQIQYQYFQGTLLPM